MTHTVGAVLTAAQLNQTRDNLNALRSRPKIHVATTTAFTVPHDTLTLVEFDAAGVKRGIQHSTTVSPDEITILEDAFYVGAFNCGWNADPNGRRFAEVQENGTRLFDQSVAPVPVTGEATNIFPVAAQWLATDVITVAIYQNSGGDLDAFPNFRLVMETD